MATSKEPSKVPGMELLTRLATVSLHQTKSSFKGSKFEVLAEDELLFDLKEDGNFFTCLTKGHIRGFHVNGVDNMGQHVFSLRRPNTYMSNNVELYMDNKLVSIIRKEDSSPMFHINDAEDAPVLRVQRSSSEKYSYQLQAANKTEIGSITKHFLGVLKEMFSYNDDYTITFPADLDVRFKLAVICTCVFIDYRYYES